MAAGVAVLGLGGLLQSAAPVSASVVFNRRTGSWEPWAKRGKGLRVMDRAESADELLDEHELTEI